MARAEQTTGPAVGLMPTSYDRAAVDALGDERLAWHAKGWPMEPPDIALRDVGAQGWRLLGDDLAFPVLTLREDHVAHNVGVMAEYAAGHRALLAPHVKTTMAPQLFARQIDAGCWAL